MAKRGVSRSTGDDKKASRPIQRSSERAKAEPVERPHAPPPARQAQDAKSATLVQQPPSAEAIALFQRGMEALQRHAYTEASTAFNAVLMGFAAERALLDRARVYLDLCTRELNRRPAAPKTIEERLTAATAALNNGDDASAEELVRNVLGDDPKHDLALYLLAAIHARRGALVEALDFLGKAIAISPEASAQARADDDFLPLHDEDAFWKLTEAPISSAGPRRRRRG